MPKFSVSKNDSRDLGFARLCLAAAAIDESEFHQWVYWVIEKSDEELPTYFFELADLEDRVSAFYDIIGFAPTADVSDRESTAVDGIAYKRGHYDRPLDYDPHIGREVALRALEENPHIEQRFNETFPFIDY